MKHRHFDTFDALRFFACLKVFLLHLPIVAFPVFSFLKEDGGIGVVMFFVLSGFLITYILIEEKTINGKLNLRNFYVNRILRIVPLYYTMILFAFCTPYLLQLVHLQSSNAGYTPNWLYQICFLGNYEMIFNHAQPNVSPLEVMWAVCVEVQFYLLWGIIMKITQTKYLPVVFAFILVISNCTRILCYKYSINTLGLIANFDYFIYGAIPAYCLLKYGEQMEKWITKIPLWLKYLSALVAIAMVCLLPLLSDSFKSLFIPSIAGLMFGWLVTLFVPGNRNFRIKQTNIFSRLGNYTYGFYLFQCIWIMFFVKIFDKISWSIEQPWYALLLGLFSFTASMITAWLSYHYYEKPFLKLKTLLQDAMCKN